MPNLATLVGNVLTDSGISATATTSGTSGSSGINGNVGASGTSGTSGTSARAGTSGVNGISGTSGTAGTSGINGNSGVSGRSGTSGTNGTNGSSGVSGVSATGSSGTSGSSGVSGGGGTAIMNDTGGGGLNVYYNSGDNNFYANSSFSQYTGNVTIGKFGSATNTVLVNGINVVGILNAPKIKNVGVTSSRNVYVDSNGRFGYLSSTIISKMNIETLTDVSWLSQLRPVTFNYRKKDEDGNYTDEFAPTLIYGLIAEETEPINDNLVFYDILEDGSKKLAGVEYNKLISPMLLRIQQLEKELEILELL